MVAVRAVRRVDVLVSMWVVLKVGVMAALLVGQLAWCSADESVAMMAVTTAGMMAGKMAA